jgi:hypothetical protein
VVHGGARHPEVPAFGRSDQAIMLFQRLHAARFALAAR